MQWVDSDSSTGQVTEAEAVRSRIPAEAADLIHLIPRLLREQIAQDRLEVFHAFQFSRAVVERFTPEMMELDPVEAIKRIVAPTVLSKHRMMAPAGDVNALLLQRNPKFVYFPYIPLSYQIAPTGTAPLIINVHGTYFNPRMRRADLSEFAERNGCFLLSPQFHVDTRSRAPDEEYKYLLGDFTRFDHALIGMIDELSEIVKTKFSPIILAGYSGGGQFAHRFLYANPDRIDAVSIGAPGYVTLPTDEYDWGTGIRNFATLFGHPVDFDAVRQVKVHIVVGEEDRIDLRTYSIKELGLDEGQYAVYGHNRVERATALANGLRGHGVNVRFDVLSGIGHEASKTAPAVMQFINDVLAG